MRSIVLLLAGTLALAGFALAQEGHELPSTPAASSAASPGSPEDVRLVLRGLWEEHLVWTHRYVVSALAGLPDAEVLADRMLRHQDALGAALEPKYGRAAADELTALLREQVLQAVDVVRAAREGDPALLGLLRTEWAEDASDLAAFLGARSPRWSAGDLEELLKRQQDLLMAQVTARLRRDWVGDLRASDEALAQVRLLADLLAAGLAQPTELKPKIIRN